MEKIYRVKLNKNGAPNFATAEEIPQGEWLIFDDESDLYVDVKCSSCRKIYTVDSYKRDDIGFTIEDLKFCPNCGARMFAKDTNVPNKKGADDE